MTGAGVGGTGWPRSGRVGAAFEPELDGALRRLPDLRGERVLLGVLREPLDQEARAQAVCTATDDFAEGMKAFADDCPLRTLEPLRHLK